MMPKNKPPFAFEETGGGGLFYLKIRVASGLRKAGS
jgi:hypothetical protein